MTVPNTKPVNRFISTELDRYDFSFGLIKKEDLEIIVTDPQTFAESALIYETDYTITKTGTGGFIKLTPQGISKTPSGHYVTLVRHPEFSQEIKFTENSAFHMNTVETGFDSLCQQVQYLRELMDHCVKSPIATTGEYPYFNLINLEKKVDQIVQHGAPDADEATKGIARFATTSEALAGTDDTKTMTPLKVAQVVTKEAEHIAQAAAQEVTQMAQTLTQEIEQMERITAPMPQEFGSDVKGEIMSLVATSGHQLYAPYGGTWLIWGVDQDQYRTLGWTYIQIVAGGTPLGDMHVANYAWAWRLA